MDPNGLARLWGNHKVSTLPAGQTEEAVTFVVMTDQSDYVGLQSELGSKLQISQLFFFFKKSHQTLRVFKLALNKKRQKILKSSTTYFFLTQRMFERNLISQVKIKEAGCDQM